MLSKRAKLVVTIKVAVAPTSSSNTREAYSLSLVIKVKAS